jgi:ubiquitin-protein ligase
MFKNNFLNLLSIMMLQKFTIERIANDVKYIIKDPIPNIYYKHDENNILIGYALIIGPEETPYNFGNYLFKFDFPENYPYSPPKLTYISNDGYTRFNPNLYINGKVCLSILNTWKGESWTSCQTISTILLTLSSILTEKPLKNEPGIDETNNLKNIENYSLIIKYKNIEYTIIKQIENVLNKNIDINIKNNQILLLFKSEIINNFLKNQNKIKEFLNVTFEKNLINVSETIYNTKIKINKDTLVNDLNKIINLIKN